MIKLLWLLLFLLVVNISANDGDIDFSYNPNADNGPNAWYSLASDNDNDNANGNANGNANSCAGDAQSPIDISKTTANSHCDDRIELVFNAGTCEDINNDFEFTISSVGIRVDFAADQDQDQDQDNEDQDNEDNEDNQDNDQDYSYCQPNSIDFDFSRTRNNGTARALQFHVHCGSEHRLNGESLDGEIHIVHGADESLMSSNSQNKQNGNGGNALLVVGILLQASDRNPDNALLNQLLNQWNTVAQNVLTECENNGNGEEDQDQDQDQDGEDADRRQRLLENGSSSATSSSSSSSSFNIYDLLPAQPSFYQYSGSLTTPPCTETVDWYVLDTPLPISNTQLAQIQELIVDYTNEETCALETNSYNNGYNNRPTQELKGRTIQHLCSPQSASSALWLAGGLLVSFIVVGLVLAYSMARKAPSFGKEELMDREKSSENGGTDTDDTATGDHNYAAAAGDEADFPSSISQPQPHQESSIGGGSNTGSKTGSRRRGVVC